MFFIRKIKWVCGKDMSNTDYIINNIFFFCRGLWPGLMFSVSGLGLYKYEREFYNVKRFETRGAISIYIFKWLFTYDKEGYLNHFKSVDIVYDKVVFSKFKIKQKLTEMYRRLVDPINDYLHKLQFKEKYQFGIDRYHDGSYKFISDMLSAFQLAGNHEADLFLIKNGRPRLLYSPLGLSHSENAELVLKHLGRRFSNGKQYKLRGYKHPCDQEIEGYTRVPCCSQPPHA